MKNTLALLSLVAATLAVPALAQEEAAPAPQQPATSADDAAVGDLYQLREGAWTLVCEKTLTGDDPCSMMQLLRDGTGNPVMQAEVNRAGADGRAAVMQINTPLLTLLPRGVSLSIDEGKAARVPFLYCDPEACVARVDLRPGDLAAFKQGNKADLAVVPITAPDQSVAVTMSLEGFTAAFDALPGAAE